MQTDDHFRINLSLISHTNIGKTTLTRTLTMRDVGTVKDEAHVTQDSEGYVLVRDNAGCELKLWDTPGFGDSVRLAKRLEQREKPLGWFLSQVWDRFTDKAFWLNQKAIEHVRDISDVILYLVEAHGTEGEKTFYDAEIKILSWMNKPVIVLLNQTKKPLPPEEEAKLVATWKERFAAYPVVKHVLPMDAFFRCWVQERTLLDTIGETLPESLKPTFASLRESWIRSRNAIYSRSLDAMSVYLRRAFEDQELAKAPSITGRLKQLGNQFGLLKEPDETLMDAQTALSSKVADNFCRLTDKLIQINHLSGTGVSKTILQRMKSDWKVSGSKVDLTTATAVGAASGASTGAIADVATGGLSLGLATLIGGIIGAIGAAGIAKAYNSQQKKDGIELSWSAQALNGFFEETVLLYLAIAHFGRGRGEWAESESPEFWKTEVQESMKKLPLDWDKLPKDNPELVQNEIVMKLDAILRELFQKLYQQSI